jgi:hypothetical protein
MGRPLNNRFFGNRNVGSTSTTADNGIGGQGVASVTLNVLGSYTTRPTITFAVPTLPGGVRATGTITSEVLSATISGGTGYGNAQTFDLTVANAAGETAVLNVTSDAGGAVVTVNSITTRGTCTALTAVVAVSGGTGTLAVPVLTYRAKAVVITEAGSGYVSAPTPTFTQSVTATSVALTTDSGALNSTNASTNQQNAIVAYAYVTGNNLIADIKKQVSGRRYKVTTSEGTLTCKLVTDGVANAVGEMTITATDANGNTYYVSKLTRHKATLVRLVDDGDDGDWVYATGAVAPWDFAAASGLVVQIANA